MKTKMIILSQHFLAITISAFAINTLAAQDISDNSKIDILIMRGEYEEVIDTCRQILSCDSLNPDIYYKMGIAYQNILEDELSLKSYYNAARLNPDNKVINFQLAKSYYTRGKFKLAEPVLKNLCSTDSMNWAYAYYLTSIYMQTDKFDDAIDIYKRFLLKDSANYVYLDKMAYASLKRGDLEYATYLYNKSLLINNKNISAIKNLAFLYSAAMRPDTAIQLLTKGIETDSSDLDLFSRRAQLNYSMKDTKSAMADYLVILSSGDSSKLYLKRTGIGYCNDFRPAEAINYLLLAYEKDSSDYETCSYLGQSYYKLKDMKKSIHYYDRALKILSPVNVQLRLTYILCAESQKEEGMYQEAIASYLKAQNIKCDPNIYMIIANLYDVKINDREKAICYYQKFLDNIKDGTMNFTPEYAETIKQRLEYMKEILLEKKGTVRTK